MSAPEAPKKLRGFALQKARGDDVSAIASKGGRALHEQGKAHVYTSEEAKEAGRKGGLATAHRRAAAKVSLVSGGGVK